MEPFFMPYFWPCIGAFIFGALSMGLIYIQIYFQKGEENANSISD